MVFDEEADLTDTCLRIARFFRDESCGQCVPCRVGHRAPGGGAAPPRAGTRRSAPATTSSRCSSDVAQVMRDASICGLGQTAANAVQSAIASLGVFGGDGADGPGGDGADGLSGDDVPTPTEDQES